MREERGGVRRAVGAMLVLAGLASAAGAAEIKKPPYWASLTAGQARMRSGPGRNFPVSWLYQRSELPLRVIEVYQSWRKVEDPDGEKGWLLVNLLGDRRTGFVRGAPTPLRASPDASARINWIASPGVVGRISHCDNGWCEFNVGGRDGYIAMAELWGVDPGEQVP